MYRVSCSGTSLLEVVVAMALTALLLAGLAPVVVGTRATADRSRQASLAAVAAASQLDRLRALPWHLLADGSTVKDTWTRLEADGFTSGGTGLDASPVDALEQDRPGYADVTQPVGGAPADVRLARRWLVVPLSSVPVCLRLVVEVAPASVLAAGVAMEHAALGRAQTVRCADGVRP